ncbi:MAG: hypothetical protein JWO45_2029, partial [Spartobacteria bacterium]|nr:hypothetical protein [Spartobacteria bacterium]
VTLAHSSPVVTVADEGSALAQAVGKGQFGMNVIPKRADYLADAFRDLSRSRARLDEWGRAGRTYVSQFDQPLVMERFLQELSAINRSAKSQ